MPENDNYNDADAELTGDRISPVSNDAIGNRQSHSAADSWLNIEIYVQENQPQLLQGLESWLRLGLISQGQVKKIARHHLNCKLPEPEVIESIPVVAEIPHAAPIAVEATIPNVLQRVWQSFLDELSIRWLLFLGVFLVVVSSGVLAASQWQNFPHWGQYLVLLLYTLGFWGIGYWTGKQNNLKLTSQTLSAIATLLIPINFWAMSHLGLGRTPFEWGMMGLGAITLMVTNYLGDSRNKNFQHHWWRLLLFWLLSYLHLGWQVANFSLLAIYGGIGLICGTHYRLLLPRRRYPAVDLLVVLAPWLSLLARILIGSTDSLVDYGLAIAIFAWLVGSIYLHQARKTKVVALKHQSAAIINAFLGKIGKIFCLILFIFTWLVSINGGIFQSPLYFWQTVGISILAIELFSQRLSLYWQKRDLTAIFFIGLQTLYICKELIPPGLRNQAVDLAVVVSRTEYFPESVFGVTLFPYIVLYVLIASWLYRHRKNQLALYSEYLTLILGIVLTCLSLSNPTWRSLNLLFSTITLGYVARIRQPMRISLIYATHLLALATVVNAIAVIFPDLDQLWWGSIAIVLMVIEWGVYLLRIRHRRGVLSTLVDQSCWYFGLLLSAFSYTCFWEQINSANIVSNSLYWSLIWLTTPVMLTQIAKYTPYIRQRRLATVTSCITLILAQFLLFRQVETRLIGLLTATGLMFANAFHLRRTIITITHLGLAIALTVTLLDALIGNSLPDYTHWLPIGGAIILLLYQLRLSLLQSTNTPKFGYISQRTAFGILGVGREAKNFKLIGKYIQATDYWAITLMTIELLIVSAIYWFLPTVEINSYFWHYLLTTGLLTGAIFWRYQAQPNNLVLYTLTWLSSLFTAGLLKLFASSTLLFATGNIILGIVALVVVVLIAQSNSPWAELNLSYVPVVYAALGIIWRLSDFNAYTGLLSLGAALILLNTQPRNHDLNRLLKYLGFAGISWGIYELVIYQMQSASGGSAAGALTILGLVAAVIAFTYRLTAWWYRQRESTTWLNLKLSKVILIAHIHWAISSVFKIIAAGIAIETNTPRLTIVSIATSFCLGAYALIQGRDRPANLSPSPATSEQDKDWWVYVGLVEIAATLVYSRLIISRLSLFDPWRIVFTCAIALLIYQIPWQNFGWRSTPWQRTALIIPALMALVTAEDISYFSLLITALFYLRIAYAQRNVRWSYLSLGLINWLAIRLVAEYNPESILVAAIISFSILYVAQVDPYLKNHRQHRHYLRLLGCSILCLAALFEQPGIIPGAIAFAFIFLGLGMRIRAFLFTGTICLVITVLHQLIILVFTYSFLKWVVGLLAGIGSIAIAAGFENKRDQVSHKVKSYGEQLKNWQ